MTFTRFGIVYGNFWHRARLSAKPDAIQSSISFSVSRGYRSLWYPLLTAALFIFMIAAFTACNLHSKIPGSAPVLLFNATGASPNDVAATEKILDSIHISYVTANSSELNGMTPTQLMRYRLLIIPGGDFMDMGKSLSKPTAANIRYAVQHGLNYLGICAGAFLAGSSKYYNGFNLTAGVTFSFYAAESKGIRKAVVAITSPGAATLDQYWEDGPQLSGWGAVIARYPDGSPAVAEAKCGTGLVMLTGIHAEAPADWRRDMVFHTPANTDHAFAAMLVRAALNGTLLPHY